MDLIFSRSSEVMNKAMNGLLARHEAISSNLANVDTPGYKAVRVEFENQLREAVEKEDLLASSNINNSRNLINNSGMLELKNTHIKHYGAKPVKLQELQINSYQDANVSFRNDKNGVDIETEMAELAKNDLKYQAIANLESKQFAGLKDTLRQVGGS